MFTFENQGNNTYLTYEIQPGEEIDSFALGMLTNNSIPGLAAAIYTQIDNAKYIKFNVSAKVSAKQLFMGPVNKKRLLGVFSGIVDAMLSAEDYMLDSSSMVLDLDYIFADVTTCETVVVCIPISDMSRKAPDLASFFKNIIFNAQIDQTEDCSHIAQLLNYLNGVTAISLHDFKELLNNINGGPIGLSGRLYSHMVPNGQMHHAHQEAQPQSIAPNSVQEVKTSAEVKKPEKPVQPVPNNLTPPHGQPVPPQTPPANIQAQQGGRHQYNPGVPPVQQGQRGQVSQINIPGQPQPPQNSVAGEKPMSMFYLLGHYTKENKEIYDRQQNQKKQKQNGKSRQQNMPAGMNIPGQNPGFNIPGQPAQNIPPVPGPGMNKNVPNRKNQGVNIPGGPQGGMKMPNGPQGGMQIPGGPQGGMKAPNGPQGGMQIPGAPQGGMQIPGQGGRPPVQPVTPVQQPAQPNPYQVPMPNSSPLNFGETTVLGGGGFGETTVLSQQPTMVQPKPHLIRKKNNEKINLDKPVYRIGKEKSYVDYFIGDNAAISRSHANVISRDGKYFVVDTNSTNHTYVNGTMIQSNVETPITPGTIIKLANEDFEFRLN